MHAYITLCLATGIRTEEARALRWEHVEFGDPDARPPVSASAAVWRSVRAHGDTKTERSRRTLGLPEMAIDALRAHKKRQAGERLAAGAQWSDQDLVFCTRTGGALDAAKRPARVQGSLQGYWDRGGLDATGVASLLCVADVQFGSPRGGDRADKRDTRAPGPPRWSTGANCGRS